jgi:hypothetical protein
MDIWIQGYLDSIIELLESDRTLEDIKLSSWSSEQCGTYVIGTAKGSYSKVLELSWNQNKGDFRKLCGHILRSSPRTSMVQ